MPIPFVLVDAADLRDIPIVGYIDASTPDLKVHYTHRGFFLTMKAQTELAQDFQIPAPDAAPGIVTGMISNAPGTHVAKPKFKVGQKVKAVAAIPHDNIRAHQMGEVVAIPGGFLGVKFNGSSTIISTEVDGVRHSIFDFMEVCVPCNARRNGGK